MKNVSPLQRYSKKPQTSVTAPPGRGAVFNKKNETLFDCQRGGCRLGFAF